MSYDLAFTGQVVARAIMAAVDRVGTQAAAEEAEVLIRALELRLVREAPLRPKAVLNVMNSRPPSLFIFECQSWHWNQEAGTGRHGDCRAYAPRLSDAYDGQPFDEEIWARHPLNPANRPPSR